MHLPKPLQRFTFPVLMSLYMVSLMTALITWVNTGLDSGFLLRWGQAFLIAWPVAFVLILIGAPHLLTLTARLNR